jgi:hypothetical protein
MLRYVLFLLWVEIWLFLLAWGVVVLAAFWLKFSAPSLPNDRLNAEPQRADSAPQPPG